MKEPLVSIVIPIYNMETYLEECIQSVLIQTYKNLEIILVNDGSTDSSAHICNRMSNCDKRVKVIHQHNQGVCAARNAAIKICTGDYIAFVDPDDKVPDTMIERMLKSAMKNNADAVYGCFQEIDKDGNQISNLQFPEHKAMDGIEAFITAL